MTCDLKLKTVITCSVVKLLIMTLRVESVNVLDTPALLRRVPSGHSRYCTQIPKNSNFFSTYLSHIVNKLTSKMKNQYFIASNAYFSRTLPSLLAAANINASMSSRKSANDVGFVHISFTLDGRILLPLERASMGQMNSGYCV